MPTSTVSACSFCGDGFTKRMPLRGHFADAKIVALGRLANPKPAADGVGGTTEFHVDRILKSDPQTPATTKLLIPRYLPIVGDTPPQFVFFCTIIDGKPEATHGVPTNKAIVDYLVAASKLPSNNPRESLGFFFQHLEHDDNTISTDAFVEFARASDTDIVAAKGMLNRALIRKWLSDSQTPEERLGVYGLLLGLCGQSEDATWLAEQLAAPSERVLANYGGWLTGLILLDAPRGWACAERVLGDAMRSFSEKLSVIAALRFFQATRAAEHRAAIVGCYRKLIANGDLADLAIDDLRRWGWWDLTESILAAFHEPTHKAPIIRRGIIRYAMYCPQETAKAFLAAARMSESKLVEQVEQREAAVRK